MLHSFHTKLPFLHFLCVLISILQSWGRGLASYNLELIINDPSFTYLTETAGGVKGYRLYRRWSWTCSELETHLRQFADTSLRDGWLWLHAAGADSNINYRVPGTEFKYKCSSGFELDDFTNPDRVLKCEGSRKVDFSSVTKRCIRKSIISNFYPCFI